MAVSFESASVLLGRGERVVIKVMEGRVDVTRNEAADHLCCRVQQVELKFAITKC